MPLSFRTLESVSLPQLVDVYNDAFKGYVVPHTTDLASLTRKITAENISPLHSAGAFDGDRLVAFILHAVDGQEAYNAGTGVIDGYRGNGLTEKMYGHCMLNLSDSGINRITLECLVDNPAALKTYERIGFSRIRTLDCYEGNADRTEAADGIEVKVIEPYWDLLTSFWDWHPTWQNSCEAVMRLREANQIIGAFHNDQLLGYAVYDFIQHRVRQFAVDGSCRRTGVAGTIFRHISRSFGSKLFVINVDAASEGTRNFLGTTGLSCTKQQYEMEMLIG